MTCRIRDRDVSKLITGI